MSSGDTEDINRAVSAARAAFRKGVWSNQAPNQRQKVLKRFAELIRQYGEELALLDTLDMGKPISVALNVDIPSSARCIEWYAEAIDKIYDEVAPTGPGSLALVTREPMGVVGAIVPWNYPLFMAAWKIGPVLAAGNSLVLKPSEKSPLSAIRLAQLAVEAGVPDGVFNVVPGLGQTAGKALALHMDVDCITFTGSTATGRNIMQYAGQSNMKRVSLECGGKSPNIVMADCPDLDKAATAAALCDFRQSGRGVFRGLAAAGSGQRQGRRYWRRSGLWARAWHPGDPLDPATRLGAIVDDIQTEAGAGLHRCGPQGRRKRVPRRPPGA